MLPHLVKGPASWDSSCTSSISITVVGLGASFFGGAGCSKRTRSCREAAPFLDLAKAYFSTRTASEPCSGMIAGGTL